MKIRMDLNLNRKRKAKIILKIWAWAPARMDIILRWEFPPVDLLMTDWMTTSSPSCILSSAKDQKHTPYELEGFLLWCRTKRTLSVIYAEEYKIYGKIWGSLRQQHIQLIQNQLLSIPCHSQFFYMNTANHIQTPRVLTRVTYRECYHRKWADSPHPFSPDRESPAVATADTE